MCFRGLRLRKAALLGAAFLFVLSAGCAALMDPRDAYDQVAADGGFERRSFFSGAEQLRGYSRLRGTRSDMLTLYIEGDGAPWPWSDTPPPDPTPIRTRVLQMASAEPGSAVAYLARPCQFLPALELRRCPVELWSRERFSEPAVRQLDRAVQALKQEAGAKRLRLVGFSGGGTMAALLALMRDDVEVLITAAAPMNLSRWTKLHRVSGIAPEFDLAERLRSERPGLLQIHLVGDNDAIVPPSLFHPSGAPGAKLRVVEIPGFDHDCCWGTEWSRLLTQISRIIAGE